ncbi:MAG: methyltransferase domain-containing protein [Planctomycetaceae bacterium]|nr:methyltransferase domain-containing protein [Planctomycetaceae bacterium]
MSGTNCCVSGAAGTAKDETREVGRFIPLHYHFQMLTDQLRMAGFREAIQQVVKPGATVLELGSGTGILSFYAAEKARKVYSVEFNGELVEMSRRTLLANPNGDKVEVIHGDAFTYLPPEPVNAVICEMLHVGLLREKQLQVINSFKQHYTAKFPGHRMPDFIPVATLQGFQPVQYDFTFEGYTAAVPVFSDPTCADPRATGLGNFMVYQQLLYESPYETTCGYHGEIAITYEGTLNALRFVTKNLLAIRPDLTTIDWHNQYLIMPLEHPVAVVPGQVVTVSFDYESGGPLSSLRPVIPAVATKKITAA